MATRARLAAVLTSVAAMLLVVGCTSTPGSDTPTNSPPPSADSGDDTDGDDRDDFEGVLLDDGRMFAVVTWGSSTCVPQIDQVAAEGQTVTVSLVEVDSEETEKVCTSDLAPRASVGALPEGVDPTQEITLQVSYGDLSDDVDLDGGSFAGTPGTSTEYLPSAGWFEDGGLVLLTWGSSSCAPVLESVEAAGNAGTVTFVTDEEQVCTMDMAPRATIIAFGDDTVEDDGPFTLTMVGGALDGTVEVS